MYGPHWVCPISCGARVLSWSTLLRLQVALQGNSLKRALGCVHFPGLSCSVSGSWVPHKCTDSVGHAFCVLPRSEQLRLLAEHTLHRWLVHLFTSPVLAARFPGCTAGAPSQGCHVSSGELISGCGLPGDVNHPVSQEDLVSNWEPARSLVEDAVSGAEIAPFWLWLSPSCLTASGGGCHL